MWEYTYFIVKDEDSEDVSLVESLNVKGTEGWEFFGYTEDTGYAVKYLLKRKV